MTMIERVKKLSQLKHMLGQIGWFGSGYALVDYIGRLGRGEPEFPEFISDIAGQVRGKTVRRQVHRQVIAEGAGVNSGLAEDAGCADNRTFAVHPLFTPQTDA